MNMDAVRHKAIDRFIHRCNHIPHLIDHSRKVVCSIPKIDNTAFFVGSAMLFRCKHCGWPTAILDEEYLHVDSSTRVPDQCLSCQDLQKMGWLDDAVEQVRGSS